MRLWLQHVCFFQGFPKRYLQTIQKSEILTASKVWLFIQNNLKVLKILTRSMEYGSKTLQWRHNERHGVSNHRRLHCLLHCWFRRRLKKTSKLCVTDLWVGNSPGTGELPAQKASNAENVSIFDDVIMNTWLNYEISFQDENKTILIGGYI